MKRTSLRVEPISGYLERYRKGSKAYPVAIAGNMVFVCGFRRLRPGNPIERGHAFRSKAATFSDEGDQAPLPAR